MTFDDTRKRAELSMKLDGLDFELDRWLEVTAPDADLEKHNSQLLQLTRELRPLLARVRESTVTGEVGSDWRTFERETLELHRVWDLYREKLALRFVPWLRDYLVLADEFAWASYHPAQTAAEQAGAITLGDCREPPLVSLSSVAAPFSITRGSSLATEMEGVDNSRVNALIDALPIPMVNVPWHQLRHLPDVLIVGHEVGHLVLSDFGLASAASEAVAGALQDTDDTVRSRWSPWLEEVFCDVYGAVAGGPAYPLALADFLLVRGADPTADGNSAYPPSAVRLCVSLGALAGAGCAPDDLHQRLAEPLSGLSADLRHEARLVGRALVTGVFPTLGGPLTEALSPMSLWPAKGIATEAMSPDQWGLRTDDIRTLVATAVFAFNSNPERYREIGMTAKVLERAREIQQSGVRFRAGGDERDDNLLAAASAGRTARLWAILSAD